MIYETLELFKDIEPRPTLTTYVLDDPMEQNTKRPAVLVCPGGGYSFCSPREAEPIAMQYNAAGFHAFVLNYSVAPHRYPQALKEVSKAIQIIRENAEKWNVEAGNIAVIGFSAGAHLAGSIGMFWNSEPIKTGDESNRPNAIMLAYPVITSGEFANKGSFDNLCGDDKELIKEMSLENHVSKDTPPMFIWHTWEDTCVPVENSLMLAAALKKGNVPFELHIYPKGAHGLSTATPDVGIDGVGVSTNVRGWVELSVNWLRETFRQ